MVAIPTENIVMGLREQRNELAEQLARLEATRERVEADLDAIDRSIQPLSGKRSPSAAELTAERAVKQPRQRKPGLTTAVINSLAEHGPLTTADVVCAVEDEGQWPSTSVAATLSSLQRRGRVTSCASATNRRAHVWALTKKGGAA